MPAATGYTLNTTTEINFADAVERVRTELREEGFGVLCEIRDKLVAVVDRATATRVE